MESDGVTTRETVGFRHDGVEDCLVDTRDEIDFGGQTGPSLHSS